MKRFALLPLAGLLLSSFLLIKNHGTLEVAYGHMHQQKYSSGALAGYTGAPGELNCTQCHGGAVQDGSNENLFSIERNGQPVTEYVPGETYEVYLDMFSDPAKRGFEVTVLDAENNFSGDFTAGQHTQIKTGGNRKYVTHTGSSNAPDGWSWLWTAPDEISGELRFYIATNKANGNGSSSGDQIFLSQYVFGTSAGVEENPYFQDLSVAYSLSDRQLLIRFSSSVSGNVNLNLIDGSGKSVLYQNLGKSMEGENSENIRVPDYLGTGIYFVHLMVDNNTVSKKVFID